MAKSKNSKQRSRRPAEWLPPDYWSTLAGRLEWIRAASQEPLRVIAARLPKRFERTGFFGRHGEWSPREFLAAAEALRCDARWLAVGITSPAGGALIARTLEETAAQRQWRDSIFPAEKLRAWVEYLATTCEPNKGAGVCRYCLCTDALGCGDCTWVDEAATICSACLEPEGAA